MVLLCPYREYSVVVTTSNCEKADTEHKADKTAGEKEYYHLTWFLKCNKTKSAVGSSYELPKEYKI